MQSATGSGCCFEEKRKMKRNIDICRKCGKFHHDDSDMMCLASEDAMDSLLHFVSENIGIPKSFSSVKRTLPDKAWKMSSARRMCLMTAK